MLLIVLMSASVPLLLFPKKLKTLKNPLAWFSSTKKFPNPPPFLGESPRIFDSDNFFFAFFPLLLRLLLKLLPPFKKSPLISAHFFLLTSIPIPALALLPTLSLIFSLLSIPDSARATAIETSKFSSNMTSSTFPTASTESALPSTGRSPKASSNLETQRDAPEKKQPIPFLTDSNALFITIFLASICSASSSLRTSLNLINSASISATSSPFLFPASMSRAMSSLSFSLMSKL
mmetsp:Transcript_21563/g.44985  ORF Transcript_21563/g.44985 Transcript_21563/m.44985 type:complete len:234 (-) Transcript_21563:533-1234(-)